MFVDLDRFKQVNDTHSHGTGDELSRPFFIERHELDISCSIGISLYPDDGTDMVMLKASADVAMYHAKRNGRNNFRFFVPEMCAAAPPRESR